MWETVNRAAVKYKNITGNDALHRMQQLSVPIVNDYITLKTSS